MASPTASIKATVRRNMMIIVAVSTSLVFLLWITTEYFEFLSESAATRQQFEDTQKELLKREVLAVTNLIDYRIKQTETDLGKNIKDRVYEAHSIAENIFKENSLSKKSAEIQKMIKDALRPLRYNGGRGYYFIFNMEGIEELFADRPELEGQNMLPIQGARGEYVVKDMIDLVREKEEGFYEYTWTKPGESANAFRKKAFVKRFAPYNWVIGTGEYVDDVREDIQNEVLQRIAALKFGKEGYFFGSIQGGLPLFTSGKVTKGSQNIWELTDPDGIKITQEQNKAIQNPEGGFVRYSWRKLDSHKPLPKISYVVGIPEWQWLIGAGVYLDTIEDEIAGTRATLLNQFIRQALIFILLLTLLQLLILLWMKRLTATIRRGTDTFISFCQRATSESILIDANLLEFQEFRDIARSMNAMLEERLQASRRLLASEEKFRTLTALAPVGIYLSSPEGHCQYVNECWCTAAGLTQNEALGEGWTRGLHPDDRETVFANWQKMIDSHGKWGFEYRFQTAEGKVTWVYGIATPLCDASGGIVSYIGVNVDITEHKQAEEEKRMLTAQLQQAQKLEAIGTLAGGIAHDFNNILGAVVGYAEMILDDLPPGSPSIYDINQVLLASHRAKDLVKQILAFSRQVDDQKMPIQPEVIVKEAIALLRSSLPATITIDQEIDPNAGMVLADPTQIHQIIMNLCTNAFHAMEAKGGTLTISLCNKLLSPDDLATEPDLQPGTFVQLSIKDSGEGILPEIRERIFDPFFTTKEVGKGTGLGLSMVYSIVKSSGGSISCDSRVGEGTEFRIILPVLEDHAVEENGSPEFTPHGKEHILFIDDEEILVELGKTMLERLGYHVTTRRSSLDALTTFHNQPEAFDLIITDQTMPGMTGVDFARRILQLRPEMPIILCTGYSSQISEETAKAVGIKGFAFKPLAKKDIGALIRKILDRRNS